MIRYTYFSSVNPSRRGVAIAVPGDGVPENWGFCEELCTNADARFTFPWGADWQALALERGLVCKAPVQVCASCGRRRFTRYAPPGRVDARGQVHVRRCLSCGLARWDIGVGQTLTYDLVVDNPERGAPWRWPAAWLSGRGAPPVLRSKVLEVSGDSLVLRRLVLGLGDVNVTVQRSIIEDMLQSGEARLDESEAGDDHGD